MEVSKKGRKGYTHSAKDAVKKGRCNIPPSNDGLGAFIANAKRSGSKSLLKLVEK